MELKDVLSSKKINRKDYLGLLIIGFFIFILIILISIGIYGGHGIRNVPNIIFNSIIFFYFIYYISIGYRRFIDIGKINNTFIFYVIGIFILMYGWKYIGAYSLLGFFPIVILLILPSENKSFLNMPKIEFQNIYKTYNFNFKNLLSLKSIVITIIFGLIFYGGIESYIYELRYSNKEPILLEKSNQLKNGIYGKIDISSGEISQPNIFRNKELIFSNENIESLLIDTDTYEKSDKIIKGELIIIKGKITNGIEGYKIELGKVPGNDSSGILIVTIIFFLIYLTIIFKDVATLKNKKVNENFVKKLKSYSYKELIHIINGNSSDKSIATSFLLEKILFNSLNIYKNYSSSIKNINFQELQDNEIVVGIILKEKIRKLKKEEIELFFEEEEKNTSFILSNIMKRFFNNNESNETTEILEKIIKLEKVDSYIKKLIKDSNYIYHEIIDPLIIKNGFKKEYLLLDENLNKLFYYNVTNIIVNHRLLKQDVDLITTALHIMNPMGLIIEKINNKSKGY